MRTEAKLQLYTALEQRNEIESGDKQCKVEINSAFLSKYFVHANLFLHKYKLYHTIRLIDNLIFDLYNRKVSQSYKCQDFET